VLFDSLAIIEPFHIIVYAPSGQLIGYGHPVWSLMPPFHLIQPGEFAFHSRMPLDIQDFPVIQSLPDHSALMRIPSFGCLVNFLQESNLSFHNTFGSGSVVDDIYMSPVTMSPVIMPPVAPVMVMTMPSVMSVMVMAVSMEVTSEHKCE
jgi:hypothetical protein